MVLKGCHRCGGDMLVEDDTASSSRDLVCLQCGHRQEVQPAWVRLNAAEQAGATRWLMSERPSRTAPQALVT